LSGFRLFLPIFDEIRLWDRFFDSFYTKAGKFCLFEQNYGLGDLPIMILSFLGLNFGRGEIGVDTLPPPPYITTQPRNHATTQPRNHATTQPRNHATTHIYINLYAVNISIYQTKRPSTALCVSSRPKISLVFFPITFLIKELL
jgi:hypothetical protein